MKKLTPQLSLSLGVTLGFALIVLLLATLTLVGLLRIAEINRHLQQIVQNNNVKTELVHNMKDALRERTIITHQLGFNVIVLDNLLEVAVDFRDSQQTNQG